MITEKLIKLCFFFLSLWCQIMRMTWFFSPLLNLSGWLIGIYWQVVLVVGSIYVWILLKKELKTGSSEPRRWPQEAGMKNLREWDRRREGKKVLLLWLLRQLLGHLRNLRTSLRISHLKEGGWSIHLPTSSCLHWLSITPRDIHSLHF